MVYYLKDVFEMTVLTFILNPLEECPPPPFFPFLYLLGFGLLLGWQKLPHAMLAVGAFHLLRTPVVGSIKAHGSLYSPKALSPVLASPVQGCVLALTNTPPPFPMPLFFSYLFVSLRDFLARFFRKKDFFLLTATQWDFFSLPSNGRRPPYFCLLIVSSLLFMLPRPVYKVAAPPPP